MKRFTYILGLIAFGILVSTGAKGIDQVKYGLIKDPLEPNHVTAVAYPNFDSDSIELVTGSVFTFRITKGISTTPSIPVLTTSNAGAYGTFNQILYGGQNKWDVQLITDAVAPSLGVDVYQSVLRDAPLFPNVSSGDTIRLFSFRLPTDCFEGSVEVITNDGPEQVIIENEIFGNVNNFFDAKIIINGSNPYSYDIYAGNQGGPALFDCPDALDDTKTLAEGSSAVNIDVLANDTIGLNGFGSPDVQIVTNASNGTSTVISLATTTGDGVTGSKMISYTPSPTFSGKDTIEYKITDGDGDFDIAYIYITVTSTDAPVADDESFTIYEGGTATADSLDSGVGTTLLTGDTDADQPDNTLVAVPRSLFNTLHGTAIVYADGTFTYTHDDSEFFSDTFDYTVKDSTNKTDIGTVTITITPVNDNPPIADNESFSVLQGGTATEANLTSDSTLLDGDWDIDLPYDTLTILTTPQTLPKHGTVTIGSTGRFTYIHDGSDNLKDTFAYTLSDAINHLDTGYVYVSVSELPNNPPVADNESFTVLEGGTATEANLIAGSTLLDGDTDPDLPNDSIWILTTPQVNVTHGTLTLNGDGTFSYTHDGTEQFSDSFSYILRDIDGAKDTAVVTITITPVNDNPPVADNESFTILQGATATEANLNTGSTLLEGDTDIDLPFDVLTILTTPQTLPKHGSVTISAAGTFTYIHNDTETTADTFAYTLSDAVGHLDTGYVYVSITDRPNNPPVADDESFTVLEGGTATEADLDAGISLLDGDTDADQPDNTLVALPFTAATTHGTVTVLADGTFTYTHDDSEFFSDSFDYTVVDSAGATDIGTVTITITPVNDNPPVADNESFTVAQGATATQANLDAGANLLVGDTDIDLPFDTLSILTTPQTLPLHGTVTINADGTFSYTHDNTVTIVDSFAYTLSDAVNHLDTGWVFVTISTLADDAPIAVVDFETVTKNTVNNILFTVANDTFGADGPALSPITILSGPSNGTATVFGNASAISNDDVILYTPTTDYIGEDFIVYQICDSDGDCDSDTVFITINDEPNNPPVAINDINSTLMNIPVGGNVITNDSDPDGDPISVNGTPVSGPSNGTIVLNADGSYIYTPTTGFVGTDEFTYEVCDNGGLCDQADVVIKVLNNVLPNNPPIAINDNYWGKLNTPVTGNILSNDSDPDGDNISITNLNVTPSTGTVTLLADGSFTYNAPTDFDGIVTFSYEICDDQTPSLCDAALVTIKILPIPPVTNITVAVDDHYKTNINTAISEDVSDNDSDPEGDTQSFTVSKSTDHGTLSFNANGTFNYTPDQGYTGSDSYSYIACDNNATQACDPATVYILVEEPNNPPIAKNDINSTLINTPVGGNVITNDKDPDGDALSVNGTLVSGPSNGSVTINSNGVYTYTPNTDFTGTDHFTYEVCDDGTPSLCDQAIVTIEVVKNDINENRPPVATNDNESGKINTPVTGQVLSNDFDPDNDNFSIANLNVVVSAGTVVLNANGTFTYTPPTDFVGEATFTYEICDDGTPVLCDDAVVTIDIFDIPIILPNTTVAVDDQYETDVDVAVTGNVSGNDYDPEGDAQTVTLLSNPGNGNLTFSSNGSFTYTPNAGFIGTDSYTYRACDNGSPVACDVATVYILVEEPFNPNNPPVAEDDINATHINTPVDGNVITNDWDPDGDPILVVAIISGPANGVTSLSSNGLYTYTPDNGFLGEDQFEYQLCDNGTPRLCDTATVTIEVVDTIVVDVNRPPVAVDDYAKGKKDTKVTGHILTNDFDPDEDLFTITSTTITPSVGTLVLNTDGTFEYTPPTGFVGKATFEYEICDNGTPVLCDNATVTIDILDIDTPENTTVASDDMFESNPDEAVDGDVTLNDYDPEGDNQTFTLITTPPNGDIIFNANGTFSYTPDPGYIGTDVFTYQACDDGTPTACDIATVYVLVEGDPPSDIPPPELNDDVLTAMCNSVFGNVLFNDEVILEEILEPTIVTGTSNGTLIFNTDGTFEYLPDYRFVGEDRFTYQVCMANDPTVCATAEVVITVLKDTDCDNVPDDDDIDDDDDGILDVDEGNGITDTDNDGIPNSLDIDSDNDGIVDNVEGQWEDETYIVPSCIDTDGDGWNDANDPDNGGTDFVNDPSLDGFADTDGDGIPDFLDRQTDEDDIEDAIEGHDANNDGVADVTPFNSDSDMDGLDDAYDIVDGWNVCGNPIGSNSPLPDHDQNNIRDWREFNEPEFECPEIFVPEAFSPNGDGNHDYFEVECIYDLYPNAELFILNRWGNIIFERNNYGNPDVWSSSDLWWDGYSEHSWTLGTEKVPPGTYLFVLKLDASTVIKGTIFINY